MSCNTSSLKPLEQFNQTAQEWSLEGPLQNFVFYVDRKFKMATTAGNRLTLDPMGKCSNAFFSKTYGPVLILWPVVAAILDFGSA
jgi:hypothetical protein